MTIEIRWNAEVFFNYVRNIKSTSTHKVQKYTQKNPHIFYELKTFLGQNKFNQVLQTTSCSQNIPGPQVKSKGKGN